MQNTLPPIIMELENGCISNRIVTFQMSSHFALNHDDGRKSSSLVYCDPDFFLKALVSMGFCMSGFSMISREGRYRVPQIPG